MENFNIDDSLKTIEGSLNQAKSEKTGASFYYILWGGILLIHYTILYLMIINPNFEGIGFQTISWVVFPIGGIISYIKNMRDHKKEDRISYYERVYLFSFAGFILSFLTIFIACAFENSNLHIILYPLLLGLTVFIVGGITKNNISIIAGIIAILCSGISLNILIEQQYLIAAIVSLICCIIPGYLMKYKNV